MEFNAVASTGKPPTQFATGSQRDNRKGKGRYDLLSPYVEERDAKHMENGAEKYTERNWELGQPLMTYVDSWKRHTNAVLRGDMSEDHCAAIRWNVGAFMHTLHEIEAGRLPKELDNRPPRMKGEALKTVTLVEPSTGAVVGEVQLPKRRTVPGFPAVTVPTPLLNEPWLAMDPTAIHSARAWPWLTRRGWHGHAGELACPFGVNSPRFHEEQAGVYGCIEVPL